MRGNPAPAHRLRIRCAFSKPFAGVALALLRRVATILRVEQVTKTYRIGATTAVITHNAAIAAMADRVLQLADGKLVADQRNATRAAPETLVW